MAFMSNGGYIKMIEFLWSMVMIETTSTVPNTGKEHSLKLCLFNAVVEVVLRLAGWSTKTSRGSCR